jgi:hypothetical protein
MLRPPTAMWGYNMQVTDEALDLVARAMRDRDVTIAYLQQQLANRVAADPAPPQVGQIAGNPAASEALQTVGHPDAPQSARAAKAPGVLVAPLPHTATQPSATASSPKADQPAQVTQPSPTLAGSYDVQGPQGAYDTHGWWAQEEEAAREEEARRQAAAQETAAQSRPDEAYPPEVSAPEAYPPEVSAPEAYLPEVSAPEASAPEADSPSDHTGTVPNPVITSPDGTATSSARGDRSVTSSVPPDGDSVAEAEEEGW